MYAPLFPYPLLVQWECASKKAGVRGTFFCWKHAHVERLRLLVVGSLVVGALVGTFGHESQE